MAKIFDVTVPLSPRLPVFPGDPTFEIESTHRLAHGDPYNVSRMTLGTHAGTHVDAPFHFAADGATVDALPLDAMMGPARVVEMAVPARIDRPDLERADIGSTPRVLFKTRSSGAFARAFSEDFIHLTPEAAAFLTRAGVRLVGIDSYSVDTFGSPDFAVHRALLGAGVVVVEGLDLSAVPPGTYDLTCLPLRIEGADGAPARVVLRTSS